MLNPFVQSSPKCCAFSKCIRHCTHFLGEILLWDKLSRERWGFEYNITGPPTCLCELGPFVCGRIKSGQLKSKKTELVLISHPSSSTLLLHLLNHLFRPQICEKLVHLRLCQPHGTGKTEWLCEPCSRSAFAALCVSRDPQPTLRR